MPQITTQRHADGTFTLLSNGITKKYKGCLKTAKKDFIRYVNYLLK